MKVGVKADYQKYKHWAPWTSLVKIKGMDTQIGKTKHTIWLQNKQENTNVCVFVVLRRANVSFWISTMIR